MCKWKLAAVLALLVCSTLSADSYNQAMSVTDTKASNAASDQELAKRIRDKLAAGWFTKGYENVSVQVRDGVVTLTGSVKSQSDKDKIEKEVRELEGVKTFNSQIKVEEPSK